MKQFVKIVEYIQNEYINSENIIGWRFLASSYERLNKNNGILLITMNPGGKEIPQNHSVDSCENGCSYLVESWNGYLPGEAPLQKQVQLLFKDIGEILNENYFNLINNALIGYYIPFRSPTFKELKNSKNALKIAKNLWTDILFDLIPKVIITFDKQTYKDVSEIYLIKFNYKLTKKARISIGWGDYCAEIITIVKSNTKISIIRFPHPSRFAIFGRKQSSNGINMILSQAFEKEST